MKLRSLASCCAAPGRGVVGDPCCRSSQPNQQEREEEERSCVGGLSGPGLEVALLTCAHFPGSMRNTVTAHSKAGGGNAFWLVPHKEEENVNTVNTSSLCRTLTTSILFTNEELRPKVPGLVSEGTGP